MALVMSCPRTRARVLVLLLSLLCAGWPVHTGGKEQQIPRLIHRNYMAGVAALQAATMGPRPDFRAHWLTSCTAHHPGWQEIIWDEAAVLKLLQEDFPWFLPAYLSYPRLVQRSDVMRYMVLYKYGGVYLDADVECYTSMEESLQDLDLVLSCEDPGAWGQLHNAAMASTAGHPFWMAVLQEAMRRSPAAAAARTTWAAMQLQGLWQRTPFHDRIVDVLHTTGPMLLTDVHQAYSGGAPACGYKLVVNGRSSTAYPVGSWFTPCLCGDEECAWHWMVQHFKLVHIQQQGGNAQVASKWLQDKVHLQQRKQRRQRARYARSVRQQQQVSGISVEALPPQQLRVVGIHHYSASWTGWDQSHRLRRQQQLRLEMSQHVLDFFSTSFGFLQPGVTPPAPQAPCTDLPSAACADDPMQPPWEDLLAAGSSPCGMVSVLHVPNSSASSCSDGQGSCGSGAGGAAVGTELQLGLQWEQWLQQSGCDITVVSPDASPPHGLDWTASTGTSSGKDHSSSSSSSSSRSSSSRSRQQPGVGRHLLGTVCAAHDTACGGLKLQELLPQQADAPSQARYALRFSCNGCEAAILQELYAAPWALSSSLDQVWALVIDLTLPGGEHGMPGVSNGLPSEDSAPAPHLGHSDSPQAGAGRAACQASDANMPRLDELFNLLHQQLGFKGVMRQQLRNNTLRLGWVRAPSTAAQLQQPDSARAAAVLTAAAAHSQGTELLSGVCDCWQQCCSSTFRAGSSSSSTLMRLLSHTAALGRFLGCHALGPPVAAHPCLLVRVAGVAQADNSTSSTHPAAPRACSTPGCCSECCSCTWSLWGWWRSLRHCRATKHACNGWGASRIMPVLTAGVVCLLTGVLMHSVHKSTHAKRSVSAKLTGF